MVKEYRKLSHSFEEAKAENISLKSSSAESSFDEQEDADILKTELSKLQAENELLRNEISELKAEVSKSTVEMSSYNKANITLQKLCENQKQASDKTGIGFNDSEFCEGESSTQSRPAYDKFNKMSFVKADMIYNCLESVNYDNQNSPKLNENGKAETALLMFDETSFKSNSAASLHDLCSRLESTQHDDSDDDVAPRESAEEEQPAVVDKPKLKSAAVHEAALVDFFDNASVRRGVVISTVGGQLVEISEKLFAETFELPIDGLGDLSEMPKDAIFDARSIVSLSGEPISLSGRKNQMKMPFRLLCDIVAKAISVKAGSFNAITVEKLSLLTAVVCGVKMNWAKFLFGVLKKMVTAGSKQAKGFAIQISVLLATFPSVELGESSEFPSSKLLPVYSLLWSSSSLPLLPAVLRRFVLIKQILMRLRLLDRLFLRIFLLYLLIFTSDSSSSLHFDQTDFDATASSRLTISPDLSVVFADFQAALSEQIFASQSEISSRMHKLEQNVRDSLSDQAAVFKSLSQEARQEGRTMDDVQTIRFNEFRKNVLTQNASIFQGLADVRQVVDAVNAKVDIMAKRVNDIQKDAEATKEALSHQLLEFQSSAQENHNVIHAQLSELVDYIHRGSADKKEESGSRGLQKPANTQKEGSAVTPSFEQIVQMAQRRIVQTVLDADANRALSQEAAERDRERRRKEAKSLKRRRRD
ncbi:hypothetical protein F511_01714 [Dorcoceras hygrometricum]|nr:hypothetical protein F511_01714 [Dorcoceras hygrometricum]